MADNFNQPRPDDAVLGGLQGVKRRLASDVIEHRIVALEQALNYGKPGLYLVLQVLKNEFDPLYWVACSILKGRAKKELKQILRESYEERFVAKRQVEEYISYVNYELRGPIYSICSCLGTIVEELVEDPEDLQELIQEAHHQAVKLLNITSHLFDLLKIEFGNIQFNREPIALSKLLTEVQNMTQSEVEQKNLNLQISMPAPSNRIIIYGDLYKLQLILVNLLKHAIKCDNKGGVSLDQNIYNKKIICQNKLFTRVINFQVQITEIEVQWPKQKEKLMQQSSELLLYYALQGDLGLLVCKILVEAMGGQMSFYSMGEKLGLTVTFAVPICDRDRLTEPTNKCQQKPI